MGSQAVGTLTTGEQTEDVHDAAYMLLISVYPCFSLNSRVRFTACGLDQDVTMTATIDFKLGLAAKQPLYPKGQNGCFFRFWAKRVKISHLFRVLRRP